MRAVAMSRSTLCLPMPARSFFFFNTTATTELYTLSLHDALPISAGSPPAALKKGTLTVNAGRPGTGIGGIFYLASALAMPFREAYRRVRGRSPGGGNWRAVAAQLAIASGILGAMWVTGWLLGLALAAARPITALGTSLPPGNVLRTASVALALGTLAGVLAGVELL